VESVGGEREEAGDARWVGADEVVGAVSRLEAAVAAGSGALGGGVIAAGFTREGEGVDGNSDDGDGDGVRVAAAVVECDGEGDVVDVGGLVRVTVAVVVVVVVGRIFIVEGQGRVSWREVNGESGIDVRE